MVKVEKEFENLSKLDIPALVQKRKSLESERVKEVAQNFSKTQADINKVRQIKRQIAWIETLISKKAYDQD
jgi:ribosomal protein L29